MQRGAPAETSLLGQVSPRAAPTGAHCLAWPQAGLGAAPDKQADPTLGPLWLPDRHLHLDSSRPGPRLTHATAVAKVAPRGAPRLVLSSSWAWKIVFSVFLLSMVVCRIELHVPYKHKCGAAVLPRPAALTSLGACWERRCSQAPSRPA